MAVTRYGEIGEPLPAAWPKRPRSGSHPTVVVPTRDREHSVSGRDRGHPGDAERQPSHLSPPVALRVVPFGSVERHVEEVAAAERIELAARSGDAVMVTWSRHVGAAKPAAPYEVVDLERTPGMCRPAWRWAAPPAT